MYRLSAGAAASSGAVGHTHSCRRIGWHPHPSSTRTLTLPQAFQRHCVAKDRQLVLLGSLVLSLVVILYERVLKWIGTCKCAYNRRTRQER